MTYIRTYLGRYVRWHTEQRMVTLKTSVLYTECTVCESGSAACQQRRLCWDRTHYPHMAVSVGLMHARLLLQGEMEPLQ